MTMTAHAYPNLTQTEIRSIIFGVMLAMLLAALDQTIVATALPTIGTDLKDIEHLSFVVSVYLLTATAVTPLYGKASDIYGRRVVLLFGIAVFMLGSIACALAPNILVLILARAVQGLGGGGLISLAQTIFADIMPPRERAKYQALIATVFITSSLAGPVLGGFFAEHLHWSLIFWINVPLGIAAFLMTSAVLRKLPNHGRKHKLDILGAVLMSIATVTFMLALSWGGIRYPWISAQIAGLIGASICFWVLFVLRLRQAEEPLIPAEVLRNGVVVTATIAAGFAMGTFIGLTIYMPIYLEVVHGLTASQAGLALIPLMIGTVVGATTAGRAMAKIAHYKRLPMIGLLVSTGAMAVLMVWQDTLPLLYVEVLFAITSIGLGTVLPVTTVSIQNAVMPHQLGVATSTMNFFRSLGGAIIVAGMGAIILQGLPPEAAASGMLEHLNTMGAGSGLAVSFRFIFATAALGLFFAWLAIGFMEELPLRGRVPTAAEETLGG